MKCIVGLGNPGREYETTRHNIGFLVLDELAARNGLSFRRSWRVPARIAKGTIGDEPVWLVKPQTYMNRSGAAVGPILRKGKGAVEDLLVVFDDTALEWGRLRVRAQGSAGGHNGVQSVLNTLGDGAFGRIRVGIGLKPDKVSLSDYVLGPFSAAERETLDDVIGRAADAAEMACGEGVARAMNIFN
ncbi:MAG: aminoacyl-tRNA hydrolase [Kiritimatiellales bacterium]|nr:aminoacyl-tRNA hydrolase [Kiritimatiellota bacterium]MBL7011773.1 aminoacyl-tRNA hydrolase [Kiritimatiellales bacterium]